MLTLSVPAALGQLLTRLGLTPESCRREDGRLSLHYRQGRLDLHLLAQGQIVFETVVAELPEEVEARTERLQKAAAFAAGRLLRRADVLALTPGQNTLLLQWDATACDSPAAMETALHQFLDSAEIWRRYLTNPASMPMELSRWAR